MRFTGGFRYLAINARGIAHRKTRAIHAVGTVYRRTATGELQDWTLLYRLDCELALKHYEINKF